MGYIPRHSHLIPMSKTQKYISIFFVFTLFLTLSSSAQGAISGKFEREVENSHSNEITKGEFFYEGPKKMTLKVSEPVNQFMFITENIMTIYYPAENRAFRISAKEPMALPFAQFFMVAVKEDYGLEEMGYTLTKHEIKGDTLYTYWDPQPKYKKLLGVFILGETDNGVVYTEAKTPDGKPKAKSFYAKHIKHGNSYLPAEIYSEFYDELGTTKEHLRFYDLKLNIATPEWIQKFELPDSVRLKEVEW